MTWKQYLHQKPLQVIFIVFALLVVKELLYIQTFRGDVSPIADGYSEANTIRGGTGFYVKGITSMNGLPDTCYGNLLPDRGRIGFAKAMNAGNCEGKAYIHYPPGPEYMAWLGFHLVGIGNWTLLRLLPIALSVMAGLFFLKTSFHLVGGRIKGLVFGLLLILPPMFTNYMHGLHHQQYAFLMFQFQMGLTILYFTNERYRKFSTILIFALLGFFQGWMTFDFAFLATLFAIPFYLYFRQEYKLGLGPLLLVVLSSGLAFTFAHVIHFYQVVAYLGDIKTALHDFTGAAAHRATNTGENPNVKYDPKLIGPLTVAKDYLYRVAGRGKYLAINLMNFIWIILGLKFIKRIQFKKGWIFEFDIRGSDILALISAVILSALWSIVMKQHAHIHGFIARHYFFSYFFCCLILINRTSRVKV